MLDMLRVNETLITGSKLKDFLIQLILKRYGSHYSNYNFKHIPLYPNGAIT